MHTDPSRAFLVWVDINQLLCQLLRDAGPQNFGEIRPKFLFEFEGRFAEKPIPDKVLAVRIYSRDGHAGADLGISRATQTLPEEEFRRRLAELLLEGAQAICLRAAKKKLGFEAYRFMTFMESIVSKYLAVPLPLPASQDELELAHRWLGVPEGLDSPPHG